VLANCSSVSKSCSSISPTHKRLRAPLPSNNFVDELNFFFPLWENELLNLLVNACLYCGLFNSFGFSLEWWRPPSHVFSCHPFNSPPGLLP
jgi:hypothetical protein